MLGTNFFRWALNVFMKKSVYDTNANDIVDKAESIDDGTYSASAVNIKDAVDKKHVQNMDVKLEDSNGTKLELIDGDNPILQFTDKNTKVFSLTKEIDDGDKRKWSIIIEDTPVNIFYDGYSGSLGIEQGFSIIGDLLATKAIVADANGNIIKLDSSGISGYNQGTYIEINELGYTKIIGDLMLGQSLINKAEDVSVTVNELGDAVDKKHVQNSDTKLDEGGANEVSVSAIKGAVTGNITFTIDGGGSAITTGDKTWIRVPFACTLTGWELTADQSGSIKIDVWRDTFTNFPPTDADSITNAHEPEISAAQKAQDLDISDWTSVSILAGDYIRISVDSAATITRAVLILNYTITGA